MKYIRINNIIPMKILVIIKIINIYYIINVLFDKTSIYFYFCSKQNR